MSIIQTLISNYADLNFKEEKTGFSPIMMACHLNTENDAMRIIMLMANHTFYANQSRIVDFNAQDIVFNTCLHHAAHTNKMNLCKYLVEA